MAGARERRRYFRIDDELVFSYRRLSPADHEQLSRRLRQGEMPRQHADGRLEALQMQIDGAILELEHGDAALAAMFRLLDRKISLVGGLAQRARRDLGAPRRVNLSACGMAFDSAEPLGADTKLCLELLLDEAELPIELPATVMGCQAQGENHRVRTRFDCVSPDAEDLLVGHILGRQRQQIAESRSQDHPEAQ